MTRRKPRVATAPVVVEVRRIGDAMCQVVDGWIIQARHVPLDLTWRATR